MTAGTIAVVPGLAQNVQTRESSQGPIWDRLNLSRAALNMAEARPLVGFGWDRFKAVGTDYFQQADFPFTAELASWCTARTCPTSQSWARGHVALVAQHGPCRVDGPQASRAPGDRSLALRIDRDLSPLPRRLGLRLPVSLRRGRALDVGRHRLRRRTIDDDDESHRRPLG